VEERRKDYPNIIKYIEKNGQDLVSLKEYFDTKIKAQEERVNIIIEGQKEALNIARESMEKRLDSMNEFRQQLKDQSVMFITKAEHEFVVQDIRELRESKAKLEGKADQSSVNKVFLISIISLFLAFVGMLFSWERINKIEQVSYGYQDYLRGK
jgi:hypothetical protein